MSQPNPTFVPTFLVSALIASASTASPQGTTRVSVDSSGVEGNARSWGSSFSADGRYVAFWSEASNLVAGDTNGESDIFVRDRLLGLTERVSVSSAGAQANGNSADPSISADGRYVAFYSLAINLINDDMNVWSDVFVRDRQAGTTERVSVDSAGANANQHSFFPSISADGRYVAFQSDASNLVSGDTNALKDIFVHDRENGTTVCVSVDSGGMVGNGNSWIPSMSADGRCVAFWSEASNLVSGDTNGWADTFVYDLQLGLTERVSVKTNGVQGNRNSAEASLSSDGRYVAFRSHALNFVEGDNINGDIFVRDRLLGTLEHVSATWNGSHTNNTSVDPSISADGRYVSFMSFATNIIAGDNNSKTDIFVRDRQLGLTERVSVSSSGAEGNEFSEYPSISPDGRYVSFMSGATNFVTGDTNGVADVFVRDRDPAAGTKYCTAVANSTGLPAGISALGSGNVAAAYLVLESSPVPNEFGAFFHGASQSQIPFGNGFLCTTGGITRGAVIQATGNLAQYLYDNSDAKHSLAAFVGTTRHFQYWFRDPMGGGALFNTSNAISIAILP